jgi:hypothetical protein
MSDHDPRQPTLAEYVMARDDFHPTQYLSAAGTWEVFTLARKFMTGQEAREARLPAGTTGRSQHVVQLPRMTGRQ